MPFIVWLANTMEFRIEKRISGRIATMEKRKGEKNK
jgi:hypothetical protein